MKQNRRSAVVAFHLLLPLVLVSQAAKAQHSLPDSAYGFTLTDSARLPGDMGSAYRPPTSNQVRIGPRRGLQLISDPLGGTGTDCVQEP